MTTAAQIRTAFAAALGTIPGFNVLDYIGPPAAVPTLQFFPEKVAYGDGASPDEWTWIVQAFVGLGMPEGAQQTLDALLDPGAAGSVKAAMEADRTLGGTVDDLHVLSCDGAQQFEHEHGGLVLGSTWTVRFLKSR